MKWHYFWPKAYDEAHCRWCGAKRDHFNHGGAYYRYMLSRLKVARHI